MAVDDRARGIAHPDENMGETGVVVDDVFGESTQTFVKGALGFGIVLADFPRRDGGGGEKGEGVRIFGVRCGVVEVHDS